MFLREEMHSLLVSNSNKLKKLKDINEVEEYFEKASIKVQNKMKQIQDFDNSGSCAICVLQINNCCYFVNVGDSRAVLGSSKDSRKISCQMTIDHKPNREDEQRRIENSGGEVSKEKLVGSGPFRVYEKDKEGPGLAVSRSFGDVEAHKIGISSEPEISSKEIFPSDKFIVIASDGIWDVMNSNEVVGFVFSKMEENLPRNSIIEELVNEAKSRWDLLGMFREKMFKEKGGDVSNKGITFRTHDDITAIVMFFHDENKI